MLKFIDTQDKRLWITGCVHAFHRQPFIWQKRGYNSPEEHTQGLIDIINKTCKETDILFILGDITLNASYDDFYWFIGQIKPKIWTIWGNHNSPQQQLYDSYCKEKFGYEVIGHEWLSKITSWGSSLELKWNGQFVVFNHYPFAIFNKMHHGSWSLHSHNHGSYIPSLPESIGNKQLDCGFDVFKKPICFKEIQKIINNKLFIQKDHHDSTVN